MVNRKVTNTVLSTIITYGFIQGFACGLADLSLTKADTLIEILGAPVLFLLIACFLIPWFASATVKRKTILVNTDSIFILFVGSGILFFFSLYHEIIPLGLHLVPLLILFYGSLETYHMIQRQKRIAIARKEKPFFKEDT